MPTWKKKEADGETRFHYVCTDCNRRVRLALRHGGWELLRDDEPVVCSECALKCRLTAEGLWGAEDEVRYRMCEACPELAGCALKGRYYC